MNPWAAGFECSPDRDCGLRFLEMRGVDNLTDVELEFDLESGALRRTAGLES